MDSYNEVMAKAFWKYYILIRHWWQNQILLTYVTMYYLFSNLKEMRDNCENLLHYFTVKIVCVCFIFAIQNKYNASLPRKLSRN